MKSTSRRAPFRRPTTTRPRSRCRGDWTISATQRVTGAIAILAGAVLCGTSTHVPPSTAARQQLRRGGLRHRRREAGRLPPAGVWADLPILTRHVPLRAHIVRPDRIWVPGSARTPIWRPCVRALGDRERPPRDIGGNWAGAVYLLDHFLSDVVGSILLGIAWVLVAAALIGDRGPPDRGGQRSGDAATHNGTLVSRARESAPFE